MAGILVTVNTIIDDAEWGTIKVQLFTDDAFTIPIATDDADFRVRVLDPSGAIIRDYPASPDYTSSNPIDPGLTVDLATVSLSEASGSNDWMRGSYEVYVNVLSAGTPFVEGLYGSNVNASFVVDPAVTNQEVNALSDSGYFGVLTPSINCRTAIVTFVDGSDHDGWTLTQQDITIQPPLIPGEAAPAEIVGTSVDTLTAAFTFTNVTYEATLSVLRNMVGDHQSTSPASFEVTFTESLIAGASMDVDCGQGVCDIIPCLNSQFQDAYNDACARGGWDKVSASKIAKMNAMTTMTLLYQFYSECGNLDKAAAIKAKINALGGNCSCDCDGNTSTEPRPYSP